MISTRVRIVAVEAPPGGFVLLWFSAPEALRRGRAGQFVMVQCGDGIDPYLPRPFSLGRVRPSSTNPNGAQELSLAVRPAGKGSSWLSRRRVDDELNLVGPLGRGMAWRPGVRNVVLAASGVHLAPILPAVDDAVSRGLSAALLMGVDPDAEPLPASLLPAEVEVTVCRTNADGLELADRAAALLPWADQALVVGEDRFLRRLAGEARRLQARTPVDAILWQPLACGTGFCDGCAVETRHRGARLLCRDGPCFGLRELY